MLQVPRSEFASRILLPRIHPFLAVHLTRQVHLCCRTLLRGGQYISQTGAQPTYVKAVTHILLAVACGHLLLEGRAIPVGRLGPLSQWGLPLVYSTQRAHVSPCQRFSGESMATPFSSNSACVCSAMGRTSAYATTTVPWRRFTRAGRAGLRHPAMNSSPAPALHSLNSHRCTLPFILRCLPSILMLRAHVQDKLARCGETHAKH